MSVKVVLGALWGDEGKAKIVDFLAQDIDAIVRFQGGCNAGHTVVHNDNKIVMHMVPVGILQPEVKAIIGNGVVIDPIQLKKELEELKEQGVNTKNRLYISSTAHITLPLHLFLDAYKEKQKGKEAIGTTKKGIGPTYTDKASRIGIRMSDLLHPQYFQNRVLNLIRQNEDKLGAWLKKNDVDKMINNLLEIGKELEPLITDTPYLINDMIKDGKNVIFEGAQGTLLDIDFGTYPFVTSSNPSIGGAITGSGVSPQKIEQTIGIFKSYITRVGKGPFPTEMEEETAQEIRKKGNEFGATTGRPRRCGWFDAVLGKYSVMVNGFDSIAISLLDVLTNTDKIKICTYYQYNKEELLRIPQEQQLFSKIKPNYIELPGWKENITDIREFDDLPKNARNYVYKIEELLAVDVKWISVGPNRKQTIVR
ncbi:MAG: adenylosuccinate synthase [Candidatus Cloacimonetes bacterium]|nr:adenylosuccinate synthase [Candidatus Cloacimonadota bacterium]